MIYLNKKLIGISIAIGLIILFAGIYQLTTPSFTSPSNNIPLPNVQPPSSTGRHITVELNESMALSSK